MRVVAEDRDPPPSNGYPLWLATRGDEDGLHLALHGANPGRDTDPARLLGHLGILLDRHLDHDGRPISTLPMLTAAERHQLLVEWNATEASYPQRCLHELIADRARQTPQRTAVVCGIERLNYAELDTRANRLAHHLVGLGVGPETLVGIAVERSVEMLVGLLGILKAGGAYVPVDPAYPAERQAFMLESSPAPVLVTQERLRRPAAGGGAHRGLPGSRLAGDRPPAGPGAAGAEHSRAAGLRHLHLGLDRAAQGRADPAPRAGQLPHHDGPRRRARQPTTCSWR